MNDHDPLQRLFHSAAVAPRKLPLQPSASLENRVLEHCRATAEEDDFAVLTRLFRRAVVYSACIMVLSMGWGWVQSNAVDKVELVLVNYAMNIQLPP